MTTLEIETKGKTFRDYSLLGIAIFFYLVSAFSRIGQPIAKDDLHWLVAAKNLYVTGRPTVYFVPNAIVAHSPHSYLYAIKFAFDIFGIHDPVARLPGILSGLLTLILIFMITKSFIRDDKGEQTQGAALTTLLYATTPAVVQGSVILENDNTLLIPAILFLFFSFVKYQQEGKLRWALATGLAVTVALWVRITTPVLALFLLGLYAGVRKSSLRSKCILSLTTLLGILAFGGLWFFYCRIKEVPFLYPFEYTLDRFQYRSSEAGGLRLDKIFENLVYLTLWLGPFTTLLFLILTVRRFTQFLNRRQVNFEDVFLIGGLVIIGTYTFVGGLPFGFPKYHSPGIGLIYVFSGIALHQCGKTGFLGLRLRNVLIAMGAAFLIQILTLHDSLYLFRYQLREAATFASPFAYKAVLKSIALKTALYFALFAVLGMVSMKFRLVRNPFLLLTLFAVGPNTGTCFLQNSSGYQTGYDYGIRGTVETARFIQNHLTHQETVVAPSEIIYYLNYPPSAYLLDRVWNDEKELTRIISQPTTAAFAYSVAINPVDQIKNFSSYEPLQRRLSQEFNSSAIGSFKVWIRKT